ncbi:MAG: EcsC family protein [Anaerolineae bacterium]|nr:EcsC family protein [Anaerolineae bacterium]
MTSPDPDLIDHDLPIEQTIRAELAETQQLAKEFTADDVQSGDWFFRLLGMVIGSYQRNARAAYFQQKYPGLSPDEIADKLISVTVRYAAIAGGISGVSATTTQLTTIASAGMTLPVFLGVIGVEMLYLARIQMRLVLDLAVVYDLQLDPDDPEDILLVFGYALGVAPTEALGSALTKVVVPTITKDTIKRHITKGTLEAVQQFGRSIGIKILQRTIIKYAVPIASAAIGSGYNYTMTKSIGMVAKAHFKRRDMAVEDLRTLFSRQQTYDLVFPAAIMYMAGIDGKITDAERELYRSMVARMDFADHEQAEFHKLSRDENALIERIASLDSSDMRQSLLDALGLIAAYDGELDESEQKFLERIALEFDLTFDLVALEQMADLYNTNRQGRLAHATETLASFTGQMAESTKDVAGKIGAQVAETTKDAAGKLREQAVKSAKDAGELRTRIAGSTKDAADKLRSRFAKSADVEDDNS